MSIYTVTFLDSCGAIQEQYALECSCDDEAVDIVGESQHPFEIEIHRGARPVVRFPAWLPMMGLQSGHVGGPVL